MALTIPVAHRSAEVQVSMMPSHISGIQEEGCSIDDFDGEDLPPFAPSASPRASSFSIVTPSERSSAYRTAQPPGAPRRTGHSHANVAASTSSGALFAKQLRQQATVVTDTVPLTVPTPSHAPLSGLQMASPSGGFAGGILLPGALRSMSLSSTDEDMGCAFGMRPVPSPLTLTSPVAPVASPLHSLSSRFPPGFTGFGAAFGLPDDATGHRSSLSDGIQTSAAGAQLLPSPLHSPLVQPLQPYQALQLLAEQCTTNASEAGQAIPTPSSVTSSAVGGFPFLNSDALRTHLAVRATSQQDAPAAVRRASTSFNPPLAPHLLHPGRVGRQMSTGASSGGSCSPVRRATWTQAAEGRRMWPAACYSEDGDESRRALDSVHLTAHHLVQLEALDKASATAAEHHSAATATAALHERHEDMDASQEPTRAPLATAAWRHHVSVQPPEHSVDDDDEQEEERAPEEWSSCCVSPPPREQRQQGLALPHKGAVCTTPTTAAPSAPRSGSHEGRVMDKVSAGCSITPSAASPPCTTTALDLSPLR